MVATRQGWRTDGRPNPARPLERPRPQRPGAIEARVFALEADVAALTEDRKWMMQIVAGIAIELEGRG